MDNSNLEMEPPRQIHWGNVGVIAIAAVLLLGAAWMEKPQLFIVKKPVQVSDSSAPLYYPYAGAPQDQSQPEVLGASTDPSANQGPEIIGDDGTVQPVSMGQVLAASTEGVQLTPQDIKVNAVPESPAAVTEYFNQAKTIESAFTGDSSFASALESGNQEQINQYALKLTAVRDSLQKIPVPQGLVKLQQLQIIQYNSAIGLLQNFTQGDQDPTTVGGDLQQFLTSQQDLDTENIAVAQKYGAEDPYASLYINPDGTPIPQPDLTDISSGAADPSSAVSGNLNAGDANQ